MKIHLVTDKFIPGGGLEHIFQLVRGLKQFQFTIFGTPGEGSRKFKDLENAEIRDCGYSRSDILAGRPDLIHIHHLRPLFKLLKNPWAGARGIPVIFTAHGLHLHKYEFYSGISSRILYFARFNLEKYLLSRVNRVVAVSREDSLFLEQRYGLTDPICIANGIDSAAVQRSVRNNSFRNELRKSLGLSAHSFLFLVISRFHFQKGYDILLHAIGKLKERLEPGSVFFILVGDGEERPAMQRLSVDLKIGEWLRFLGSRNDVYDLMQAGDMLLLPSRWEGLPIVLLEAGLFRLPVAVSNTYGNREIISPQTGVLFPSLSAEAVSETLFSIIQNKYPLRKLAENLHDEVLSRYNLDNMLTQLSNLYHSFS